MEYFTQFVEFVDEIKAENSRNYKLEVLKRHADDEVVKYFLKFVFDPYITTGLSVKKLAKDVAISDEVKAWGEEMKMSTIRMLEWLKKNNTGTDDAIARVHLVEGQMTDEEKELFDRVICKNLPLGIETLTINKVMPKLISTFNVQLANKYFDNPKVVEGKSFTLTTKIDGGRIIAIKKDGVVKFYTRAGQEYEGLVDLEKEMLEAFPDNVALDGEITLLDTAGLDNKEQYKRTMMITRRLGEKHGVKMKVFDVMTADEFKAQVCNTPYRQRRENLAALAANRQLTFFEVLPILYQGDDCSMIVPVLESQIAKGEEGIMININDAPYAFDRGNGLLKVKKMKDLDLEIVGFEEGTNQNAGKLGSFIVKYKGCEVKVGSGISKELREKIWQDQDSYLGMTIIVQYFEETKNQAGGVSLRFPVFVDFRYDK